MSKNSYREYFDNVRKYVKMKPFLDAAFISNSNFSYFMRGEAYNHLLSIEKLERLEAIIKNILLDIV